MQYRWLINFVCVLLPWLKHSCYGEEPDVPISILEQPSSLLLPLNSEANLSCMANCYQRCRTHWIVNGSQSYPLEYFEVRHSTKPETEQVTITLTVNAVLLVNSTTVACQFNVIGSSEQRLSMAAIILVLTESPLPENPQVEVNASLISVQWSPPYLWPGLAIQYYNISVYNSINGSTFYRVNSTFSDHVVSFTKDIPDTLTCSEITIEVTAVSTTKTSEANASFSITEWITPLGTEPMFDIDFSQLDINVSACFRRDGTLGSVLVEIQLPNLRCNDVLLNYNYTLVVTNERNETVLTLSPSVCTIAGHVGRNITTNLTQNENYALNFVMTTCSGSHTFMSPPHYFDTLAMAETTIAEHQQDLSAVLNPVLMGISLGAVLVMLIVISTSIYFHCRRKREEWRAQELRRRLRSNTVLIVNPIYDGAGEHQYEHIPVTAAKQYATLNHHLTKKEMDKRQDDTAHPTLDSAANVYQVITNPTTSAQEPKNQDDENAVGSTVNEAAVNSCGGCDATQVDKNQSYGLLTPNTEVVASSE